MPLTWPLALFNEYGFSEVNPGWTVGDTVPLALLAYTTPGEPTELVATAQGARAVELSWTAPELDDGGIEGYRVESSVDGGVNWRELAADTGTPATSYRDASVGLGETRHYRVRGIGGHGNAGPPSEPASATALHGILGIEVTSTPALGGDTYLAGEAVEVTVTLSTAVELIGSSLGLALGDAACVAGGTGGAGHRRRRCSATSCRRTRWTRTGSAGRPTPSGGRRSLTPLWKKASRSGWT